MTQRASPYINLPRQLRAGWRVETKLTSDSLLSCINGELLKQFNLSPYVLPGPPRAPAFPLRPIALARVRLDGF